MKVTTSNARHWIILASLSVSGSVFVFMILAPAFGYPLTWAQALRILEIPVPVFLGYLGAGTHFLFRGQKAERNVKVNPRSLLNLLVKGPIILFAIVFMSVLLAFGFSNSASAPGGEGMSVDTLSATITAALGFLTVSTNVIVAHLFSLERMVTSKADSHLESPNDL